jgi:UDP-glucose 4-epimerase
VDLILTCLRHPAAANQTFLVSDGQDLSTPDLLRYTAATMGRGVCLVAVPEAVLQGGARLIGKHGLAQRLCCSLRVDISKTRELLDWHPPVAFAQELKSTVECFLAHREE